MKRFSFLCFFALSILLFTGTSGLLTAGKAAQAGWRFEIEQGKKSRLSVSINNICKESHSFGIKSDFKYLSFVQPTEAVLVGPDSTELVKLEFDATELETGVYRNKVIVDCLDCKKEPGCQHDRDELLVELSVVKSSPTSNGSGLNPVGLNAVPCCTPPPSGMVSWWAMDGSLADIKDGNNPSTSGGVSFVPGIVACGVTFATGGFIEIPQSANLSNQRFTLDAWVRPDGPGPNHGDGFGSDIIVKNVEAGNQSAGLLYDADDERFRFIFGKIQSELIVSNHRFPIGSFYHVAATYDGVTFRLYVNGQPEGELTKTKTIKYSLIPWAIGSSAGIFRASFPRTWNGVIDEVEIFNRALGASEIQAIFRAAGAGKCKP